MNETKRIPLDAVVYRTDLYPRIEPDSQIIQRYAASIDVLPPIEVNQHGELIDGFHRWTAHKVAEVADIAVIETRTASDVELLALACKRNASHGFQLSERDKKANAIRLYGAGTGMEKDEIARTLSVSRRQVTTYLTDVDAQVREQRRSAIFEMWMACHTQEQIAEAIGAPQQTVAGYVAELPKTEGLPKSVQLLARHEDADWQPPLYDIWQPHKNANEVKHFGNTPVEFVDNLLYLFTDPFDIVVDPFGGGGATIDICKRRLRRYWVSDRKPTEARPGAIRKHDVVTDGVAGPARWGDVALVYMDPPYWRQAAGQYSGDPTDLANMPLEQFTDTMVGLIHAYGDKMKSGSHLACIISPTQWPNEDKSVNYHDLDFAAKVGRKWRLDRRVLCPYSTQQYNGTQVEIAKRDKLLMVLTRTMLVWKRV